MNNIELVFPTLAHMEAALAYRQEHFDHGEREINGDGGLDHAENYETWIEEITAALTNRKGAFVPATMLFGIADGNIVGTLQIRHCLNDFLLAEGGHIGYGVRPTERRKGYAAAMLALALKKCRELGLKRVLITCNKNNIGSARTIMKNGGVLENETTGRGGKIIQRYWITIKADDRGI